VVNEPDFTTDELAEMILVAHQRHASRSCLCGWDELGRSHAKRALVGDQVDQRPYYTHDGSQRKYEEPRYAVAF
jgi:hypothetical protein